MKKKLLFTIFFFSMFFVLITFTNAEGKPAKMYCPDDDSPVNIRDNINGSPVTALACNTSVTVLNTNAGSNSICDNFYEIEYNGGKKGYACGKYVKILEQVNLTGSDNIYIKENYDVAPSKDGWIACYEDTGDVSLRSSPGGTSTGKKVSCGEEVTINSTHEGTNNYYYNITDSEGNKGYVLAYYVNTTKLSSTAQKYYNEKENLNTYYNSLRSRGFPESYLPYLAELHARYPNWVFNAEKINLDYSKVVEEESKMRRNLVEKGAFDQNYLSMDINSYDILTNTFIEDEYEKGWYNASTEAIAYYLDPRLYLNEKYIFAYEGLGFNNIHTVDTIRPILSKMGYWPNVYKNFSGNVYDDTYNITKEIGISSVHIASRINQEISGISLSDPRLGGTFTYNNNKYSGYYNFYNIRVSGPNKIVNGMLYAKEKGWDTPYKAIYGGAKFIYDDYVKVNQDTLYYEKFDVSTSDGHFSHQYMQNLAVITQETTKAYNVYMNNAKDYLKTAIVFTIPVYNNMPKFTVTSPKLGNPNNYLKDIKVNNQTVNNFSYDDYSYDITVSADTKNLNIAATPIASTSKVDGTGNISINSNKTTATITVTSQSGRKRNYKINITRPDPDEDNIVELSYILDNIGIKYNDKYIHGIKENTDVKSLINNVNKINPYASANIKDKNGNNKTSGIFKTGDTVTISNSKESKTYTILIYGDINGDGIIDKLDYLAVLRHYYGYTTLTGVYKEAADAKKDGKVDKLDYLAILRDYYGYSSIEQ